MSASSSGEIGRDPQGVALIRLRGLYPSLKKALQKVANLVMREPEMAIYASVNEVAAAAQVSEATVMRFCRILGYKGFQDFKIALARELVAPSPHLPEEAEAGEDPATLAHRTFRTNISALEETLEVLDLKQLHQAAKCLLHCRRLIVVGLSDSSPVVHYTALRFAPLGLEVRCYTAINQMLTAVALLTAEDALLAFSPSGTDREILETVREAKDHGARVIAVTSNSLAPLTRLADQVLLTAVRETEVPQGGLASFLSQFSIIDSLFGLLQHARPAETRDNLAKIELALRRLS